MNFPTYGNDITVYCIEYSLPKYMHNSCCVVIEGFCWMGMGENKAIVEEFLLIIEGVFHC